MQTVTVRAVVLACAASFANAVFAHDALLPGQSRHGREFDRGPRQRAYLMGGTGHVHFPVTTKNPLCQKFIDQGVGQLHGFWFVEAERSFRQALAIDPKCGIAYWGIALANEQRHESRAKQFIADAAKHKAGLTEREQMYIDALTSESGYVPIIEKYPDDLEAKAFEVWRLWHKYEFADPPQLVALGDAMALARQILKVDPMHPIHHAVIHIADRSERWGGAVTSADKCGETAPSIGHMWHMPTHIYFALRRYPEAAWQLEASIRTEHARMIHDRVLPDQVHLYAHNNEWLVRTLLYLGRVHDARRVAMHMIDLPRHPLLNVIEPPEHQEVSGEQDDSQKEEKIVEVHGTSAYYGRDRLLQVLRQYEYWDELIEACRSGYIEPTGLVAEQGRVHLNLGVAYYCKEDPKSGDKELDALRDLVAQQRAARDKAIAEALAAPEPQRARTVKEVQQRYAVPIAQLDFSLKELESYHRIATEFFVSRKLLLGCLAILVIGEACVFWSLRRRMLPAILSVGLAIASGVWLFSRHLALQNLPYDSKNVDFAYMSHKQLEAGDPDLAEWCARGFAKERENQVRPQANLVEILYRIGKKDEARSEFEKLRSLAGTADLDTPPLTRLAPIAREFGLPTDWRLPEEIQKALAGRRPLETLGPLVWRPWTAPDWKLKDANGREHTLAEFRGKPVLMIFFLGEGCLHCKQQLVAFAKQAQKFAELGLTVIAVSTDDQAGIKKSLSAWGREPFPFLMLSDPKQKVFQDYRAYDDFEQIALHGTFLIDSEGLCRWHDESFEPFMDVAFVLNESKRLLARKAAPLEPGARIITSEPNSMRLPVAASAR